MFADLYILAAAWLFFAMAVLDLLVVWERRGTVGTALRVALFGFMAVWGGLVVWLR